MANERLYRANIGYYLAHPEAFANFAVDGTVTVAELNSNLVFDITCALTEADTEFTLGDSDTDDELTFCSVGNEVTPTNFNPTVTLVGLRDADKLDDTVFNLFRDLCLFPGLPYIAIQRIGKPNDAAFAINDRVSLVEVETDLPVDVLPDNASVKLSQTLIPQGDVSWGFKVVA